MQENVAALLATVDLLSPADQAEFFRLATEKHADYLVVQLASLASNCTAAPVDKRVAKYVGLRDARAAFNKRATQVDNQFKDTLESIENSLLAAAQAQGVDGFKTAHGTTYKDVEVKASIADEATFFEFIRTTGDLDFFERRIKAAHLREYEEVHGSPPPGLNIFRQNRMKIRRS